MRRRFKFHATVAAAPVEGPYLAALRHDVFEKVPGEKAPSLKDRPKRFIA